MGTILGFKWEEWFVLAMLVFTVGAPVVFLLMSWRRHHMDDLDCSKYEVFSNDPDFRIEDSPSMPAACKPQYLQKRAWWSSINTTWVWFSLATAVVWVAIMLIAFFASFGIQGLRQSLPQ